MSWGVATQNGVSVSLASIVSLSCGATEFSPLSLFTSGVQGAWYAPDDYSTLFQDSAGTTPVTAVEQPVGLMLDKSQGGLGPELVTNSGFSSSSNWTLSNTTITSGNLVFGVAFGYASQAISGSAGNYKLFVNKSVGFAGAGNLTFAFYNAGSIVGSAISIGSSTLTFGSGIVTASGSFDEIRMTCSTTDAYQVDSVSLARAPGNHASQATTASRPVLRARYNLLTYSEQFDNAAWSKTGMLAFGSGSVVNATTAPDGTTTADLLTPDTSSSTKAVRLIATSAGANTWSFYAKANGYTKVGVWDYATSGAFAAFLLSGSGSVLDSGSGASGAAIVSVGNGWYRCSFTATVTGSLGFSLQVLSPSYTTGSLNTSYAANGTDGIYFWGAQLVTGSSAGTYQRIAAATDYATAGFLPYLALITDDSLSTGSIDFTATDKMFVCAGVTKLSDAAAGLLVELSTNWNSNTGSFYIPAPETTAIPYAFGGRGNAAVNANQVSSFAAFSLRAPDTCVLTAIGDISGDSNILRRNTVAAATATGDQGTGNYGNYPLYIGRRGGSTLPLEGRIYQMIVCGKTLSASELASTESYVAAKTGVVI